MSSGIIATLYSQRYKVQIPRMHLLPIGKLDSRLRYLNSLKPEKNHLYVSLKRVVSSPKQFKYEKCYTQHSSKNPPKQISENISRKIFNPSPKALSFVLSIHIKTCRQAIWLAVEFISNRLAN